MNQITKRRMFTCDEWAEMFKASGATAPNIEKVVGIPKAVFLRAVMPNGERVPIPFKYELGLYNYFKSLKKPVIPQREVVVRKEGSLATDEEMESKYDWLQNLRIAKVGINT